MKLHAYANEDGLENNDQSARFINRAGRRAISISKQLVHLRVRIPDPGSIKRLCEGFDFSLMFV